MKSPLQIKSEPHPLEAVRPHGILGVMLTNISNPRKWRWNSYIRACRAIPKHSPVAGSTNWEKINTRRCQLIFSKKQRDNRNIEEFQALQKVSAAVGSPSLVVQNFLLSRYLRRLKKEFPNCEKP